MKNYFQVIVVLAVLGAMGIACGGANTPRNNGSSFSNLKLFPSADACSYPTKSSIERFRALGGGTWRHLIVGGSDMGYDCGTSEKQISLISGGRGEATIEYGVTGTADGANLLGFDYEIVADPPLKEESSFRKDFVQLLVEVTTQALGEPLPSSAQWKILESNTFARKGVRNEEVFQIGKGQLTLSRNRSADDTYILVKVAICPHKEKCK